MKVKNRIQDISLILGCNVQACLVLPYEGVVSEARRAYVFAFILLFYRPYNELCCPLSGTDLYFLSAGRLAELSYAPMVATIGAQPSSSGMAAGI